MPTTSTAVAEATQRGAIESATASASAKIASAASAPFTPCTRRRSRVVAITASSVAPCTSSAMPRLTGVSGETITSSTATIVSASTRP